MMDSNKTSMSMSIYVENLEKAIKHMENELQNLSISIYNIKVDISKILNALKDI